MSAEKGTIMTTITVSTSPQRGTRVRGIARITIDGITVAPFRIMDSQKGLFVAMPQNQRRDGSWIDLFHALSAESRHLLQDWILTTFCTDEPATKEFSFPSEFTLATSVTPITAGNTTCIGFANLDICATFRIENIRICKNEASEPILLFPTRTWHTPLGEVKSSRVIDVDDKLLPEITRVVLDAYENERRLQGITSNGFGAYKQRDYTEDMDGSLEALMEQKRINKACSNQ